MGSDFRGKAGAGDCLDIWDWDWDWDWLVIIYGLKTEQKSNNSFLWRFCVRECVYCLVVGEWQKGGISNVDSYT